MRFSHVLLTSNICGWNVSRKQKTAAQVGSRIPLFLHYIYTYLHLQREAYSENTEYEHRSTENKNDLHLIIGTAVRFLASRKQ